MWDARDDRHAGDRPRRRAARARRRVAPSARRRGARRRAPGLPKSTTSRLVGALERRGLVQRAGDRARRARAGAAPLRAPRHERRPRRARRAGAARARRALRRDDQPRRARRRSASSTSRRRTRATSSAARTGSAGACPYESTANGKVLHAFSAERHRRRARAIRARGYAVAVDELEHGLAALAAPVFGPDGDAVAALSISGPTIRLTRERIAELAPASRRAGAAPVRAPRRTTTERGAA